MSNSSPVLGSLKLGSIVLAGGFTIISLLKQLKRKYDERQVDFEPFLNPEEQKELLEDVDVKKFAIILKKYSDKLNEMQIFENTLTRRFETEKDLEDITNDIYYSQGQNDLVSLTKSISDPVWDLLDRGGKRIRPVLCILFAQCFGKNWESIKDVASIIECIHNGSLIIDDIEDQSELRREKKCVHLIHGIDVSINAGNFLYFGPIQKMIQKNQFPDHIQYKLLRSYMDEMVNLHMGQAWDILWHNTSKLENKVPTEQHYLQMVSYKTGVIPRLCAKMVSIVYELSEKVNRKLCQFTERIGVAFQIQDDILNLQGDEYKKGKGYLGEDIHEGKMSLMVIHALNNLEGGDRDRLFSILKMRTENQELINEAIALINKKDSIEYSRQKAENLVNEAWDDVKDYLPDNKAKELIAVLAKFCIARST